MDKLLKILYLIVFSSNLTYSQNYCETTLEKVEKLHNLFVQVFLNDKFTLDEAINQSEKIAKQLVNQFQVKQIQHCDDIHKDKLMKFLTIANTRLSRYKKAEKDILATLNKQHPHWQLNPNPNDSILPHLQMLYYIKSNERLGNFYDAIRDGKSLFLACDSPISREKDLNEIFQVAKLLVNEYGEEFGLEYLSHHIIILNDPDTSVTNIWNKYHELVLELLLSKYSRHEIIEKYKNAKIKSNYMVENTYSRIAPSAFLHFIQLDKIKLYFAIPENLGLESLTLTPSLKTYYNRIRNESNFLKLLRMKE